MALLHDPVIATATALVVVAVLYLTVFGGKRATNNGKPLGYVGPPSPNSPYATSSPLTAAFATTRKPRDTLPLLGNGLRFLAPRQHLFDWFTAQQAVFGRTTYAISVPTLPAGVVVSDPAVVDHVFRHGETLFSKGDFARSRMADLFGHGIINVDGDAWRAQRKAGLAFLSRANLRVLTDVALPAFLEETEETLDAGKGEVLDMQALFLDVTTRVMSRMAYDMDLRADHPFTVAFEYASGRTAERFQNPLWRFTELFTGRRLRADIHRVKCLGRAIVNMAEVRKVMPAKVLRRAVVRRVGPDGKWGDAETISWQPEDREREAHDNRLDAVSGSLIDSLLKAIPSTDLVADAALNYLTAGRDTTAQALTWTLYSLLRNTRCLERLRKEIDAAAVAGTVPSPAALPYTLAVFYETLRLYPPVPIEIHQAMAPVDLPDGVTLPQGAVVVWCTWALGRSAETWGPDAESFVPERWLRTNEEGVVETIQRSQGEWPVFNGGARTCLGKTMAEAMAVQTLARLLGKFDFSAAWEGGVAAERVSATSLTLPMEGGLPVRVRRRRKE